MHVKYMFSKFLAQEVLHLWVLILAGTLLATAGPNVSAAPPDFAAIDDILGGRRIMLPVDDLVMTSFNGQSDDSVNNLILQTLDSEPVLSKQYNITQNGTNRDFSTGLGRLFDLPRDVIFTMAPNTVKIRNADPMGAVDKTFSVSGFPRGLTIADFTGDGYDDVAILTADEGGSTSGVIRILTANDVNNLDSGLFSSDGVGPFQINFDKNLPITAGDFNGDGDIEVAIAQPLSGNTILIYIYDVVVSKNPEGQIEKISLVEAASLRYDATFTVIDVQLTAGDYDGVPNPKTGLPDAELMLNYHNVLNGGSVMVRAFDVIEQSSDPDKFDLKAAGQLTLVAAMGTEPNSLLDMTSGRLEWFGASEQAVVLYQDEHQPEFAAALSVVVADSLLNLSAGIRNQFDIGLHPLALALGNFDQNLDATGSISLEIAILVEQPTIGFAERSFFLEIDTIRSDQNYKLEPVASTSELFLDIPGGIPFRLILAAGDTQGRSLVLGPPKKISITDHSQASIVMGAPPMHIDYIKVANQTTPGFTFKMVNMTAFPSTDNRDNLGMNTQFSIGSSSKGSNTRTQSTSFTYSTTETVDDKVSFGIPDIASVSVSMKSSAEQTHSNLVENKHGTFSAKSFEIDAKTGFGDALWYLQRQFYLWVYPVIGRAACPDDSPDCPASCGLRRSSCPKLPLQIVFSGPQVISSFQGAASNGVEWAQPPHEIGNILSYPSNQQQLETATVGAANFDLLAGPSSFETGSSGVTEKVSWTNGSTEGNTTGSVKTYSSSVSVSASASGYIEEIGIGVDGSASFSENTSSSLKTINTAVETLSSTTGVEISVPAFDDAETYSYPITGFVFGEKGSPNVIQTGLIKCLNPDSELAQSASCPNGIDPVDIVTHGPVQVGFSADPSSSTSGNWWQSEDTYLIPDVALQHQNRWRLVSQGSAPLSSQYCFNIFNQQAPLNTPAYDMKGFFVLPQGAENGPQKTTANAGEVLQLQARIHNYSLVDMDDPSLAHPAASVRVQIYGQEWCTINDGSCTPNTFVGPAFLAGETTTLPIPGSNSAQPGNPVNYKMAGVNWGTDPDATQPSYGCGAQGSKTGCAGKYLKFWVVTWMLDGSGDLVAEYKDHGLSMLPEKNFTQLGQVPIQPISNNVGLYPQVIHICPKGVQCPDSASINLGELSMDAPDIEETVLKRQQETSVSVTLHAGDDGVGPIIVAFYQGDPQNGGTVFDVEHVPFVAANSSYVAKVKYHPLNAGDKMLHIIATLGDQSVSSRAELQVTELDAGMDSCINPLSPGSNMTGRVLQKRATASTNDNKSSRHKKSSKVDMILTGAMRLSASLNLRSTTVKIDRFLNEAGAAGELIRSTPNDTLLPLTLAPAGLGWKHLAFFRSPSGQRPMVKLALMKRKGWLRMFLHIKSDFPLAPQQCEQGANKTTLETRFTSIDDGVNPPFMWPVAAEWECKFDRHGTLKRLVLNN